MDKVVAYRILCQTLEKYRNSEFATLLAKRGKPQTVEVLGPSNVLYAVEMTIFWSDSSRRSLVIQGRIDDHNTYRFSPLEEKIVVNNPNQADLT